MQDKPEIFNGERKELLFNAKNKTKKIVHIAFCNVVGDYLKLIDYTKTLEPNGNGYILVEADVPDDYNHVDSNGEEIGLRAMFIIQTHKIIQ